MLPTPFLQEPFVCRGGERVSFNADQKKGSGFPLGCPYFNSSDTERTPPLPIETTVHRESVPKTRGGGLSLNPSTRHCFPPSQKTPSNQTAVKEVNEFLGIKCCCEGTRTSDGRCLQRFDWTFKKGHPRFSCQMLCTAACAKFHFDLHLTLQEPGPCAHSFWNNQCMLMMYTILSCTC